MDEIIEFIKDMLKYIIIIAIIILIRIYVLTTTEVVGSSMEPNLDNGNILLVDQLTSRFRDYKRFEIIVFEQSPSYLIKRVVGLPGETIEYKDNKLLINGEIVEEPFETTSATENVEAFIVPDNSYYVMGDNRIDSTDSRVFEEVNADKIIGKPFVSIWPFNKLHLVK